MTVKFWQIGMGVALFLGSSMLADLVASTGVELSIGGSDYAVDVIKKILDVLAGSMIVWGILDTKPRRRRK